MNNFIGFVVCWVALSAIVALPIFWLDSLSCSSKARAMRVDKTWGPLQGCMVNISGQWMPLESYRATEGVKR